MNEKPDPLKPLCIYCHADMDVVGNESDGYHLECVGCSATSSTRAFADNAIADHMSVYLKVNVFDKMRTEFLEYLIKDRAYYGEIVIDENKPES